MIKRIIFFVAVIILACACHSSKKITGDPVPEKFKGVFKDDYSIRYRISDTLFLQEPDVRYHILKWNQKEQYIITKNDEHNPSEAGLYTRIDYMLFKNMEPYTWGFCLTEYKAASAADAEKAAAADRSNPKKGCGGFPFSRLKRVN